MPEVPYAGRELDIFAHAQRWKQYWSAVLKPYIAGDVLEVGAGIGANTPFLRDATRGRWVCLEPDPELFARLRASQPESILGTLAEAAGQRFDTILYIDVLEHIEDDASELKQAASLLRPNGRIIVLAPAHPWLFSPFDAAIGHYRRYNRAMLQAISPCTTERIFYLDAMGLFASAANKLLLKQSQPTFGQIQTWDCYIVPLSRSIADPLLGFSAGKTIVGIWKKTAA